MESVMGHNERQAFFIWKLTHGKSSLQRVKLAFLCDPATLFCGFFK